MKSELLEPLKTLRVLIVEDDPVALDLLKIPLERRYKKVVTAKKGETALKHFKNEVIDIIITDVKLDGKLDGIGMAKQMRKINPNIPVIFMTAYSDEEKINEMVELNAASLIKKAVDLEELFVLLLNINKSLNQEEIVDLGQDIAYRRRDKTILKGFATFELTDRECKILDLLLENDGYPVTYDEIQTKVWGTQPMTMDSLRMHINGIRRKTYYELIRNQSRLGYKLLRHRNK